ncbi:MAG TPA: ABC transporter ATP-binding protein [Ignavibacteria bacterium]
MNAVEFTNITKKFGDFIANDNINFNVLNNSVHCIVGENGAGKSTLMKVLSGAYIPDSGYFNIYGEKKHFKSTHDAIASKIGMLYQHFMLIDDFTVLENVILGNEISKGMKLDFTEISRKLNELIELYNLGLNINKKISELSISEQQKVEILKLLYRDSNILIFDEPTAVLSPFEVDKFFEIVNKFKSENKTIIFITHKLKEVLVIADCVTVLRKGKKVYEAGKNELNIPALSKAIVGEVSHRNLDIPREDKETHTSALKLENISLRKNKIIVLNGFNLELYNGSIHGIAGVEGNGQSDIIDVLCGLEKKFTGKFEPATLRTGVVPDDRIKKGMIKEYTIGENMILKNYKGNFINHKRLTGISEYIITEYDVRVSDIDSPMQSLSGGNQQKVIFAREAESDSEVLIFAHPTRGVDINATNFIHNRIIEQRNKNKAILLISSDLDELLSLSDTLSVLYKGRILKTFGNIQKLLAEPGGNNKLVESVGKLMLGIE